jgi:hypothetical protein
MSRFLRVLISLAVVALPGYLYLGFRLAGDRLGWTALALLFVIIFSFTLRWRFSEDDNSNKALNILQHITFLCMGFISFLFAATVFRDIVGVVSGFWIGVPAVIGAALAALGIGTFWAINPRIKKVKIKIENLPEKLSGLRIVQISDLHVGPTIGARYVRKVVLAANSFDPHLVAFTGDIGDGPAIELKDHVAPLSELKSTLGTFYVPGNHEYYWNLELWLEQMRKVGAKVLLNSGSKVSLNGESILVAGITDPAASHMGHHEIPDVQKAYDVAPDAHLKILLSHRPDFAELAAKTGFNLQLSGHTHGGQFFPWTIVVRFVHKFFLGLHKAGNMWVYVNGGTGSWGPLVRLGTTPEVTHIELIAAGR